MTAKRKPPKSNDTSTTGQPGLMAEDTGKFWADYDDPIYSQPSTIFIGGFAGQREDSKKKSKTEKAVPTQTETNGDKPEAQEGKVIKSELIQPGPPMWTDGWRIHIGGLMGTDANPIRLPKPTKPEPKPESDLDKNSKTKTKR
jgi:hypothetical protein